MIRGQLKLKKGLAVTFLELAVTAMLFFAYLSNFQPLILLSFSIACLSFFIFSEEEAIDCLSYFTSFAGIFVYQGRLMYFIMVALFIIRFMMSDKVRKETYIFYILIVVYSFAFSDSQQRFSFGNIIGFVLLFAVAIIAEASKNIDCRKMIQHYVFGFVIATIIGFFAKDIPAIAKLYSYDLMWTEDFTELTRFSGLAFDSNFYALSNYVILAYLLLAFDRIDVKRTLVIVFLIIAGLQTVSKSYFLVTGGLLICYLLKTTRSIKQFIVSILIVVISGGLFIYVSNELGYNVIELVTERFKEAETMSDITTGRSDIWEGYFNEFENSSVKELMFGSGVNAVVIRAAHNTFIELLFNFGVFGVILWFSYFIYCARMFYINTKSFKNKTIVTLPCLIAGCMFLSAYTYEAFWYGLMIAFMTFGGKGKVRIRL